jgi:superfamily II DNA/RNA helicase
VPSHAEDYVHRIGRTGRAGRSGTSVTLAARSDAKYVAAIEKLTGEKVDTTDIDNRDEIARSPRALALEDGGEAAAREARREDGGRQGRARSRRGKHQNRGNDSPRADAPRATPPANDQSRGQRQKPTHDSDRPVVGMGDHVPDFMLRPVRIGSS